MKRPYPIMKDINDFTSNEYIHLNSCGLAKAVNPAFVTYRPRGRSDWHILYQINGELSAVYEGEPVTLTAGDMLIYPPKAPHLYEYNESCTTAWLHIAGASAEYVLSALGLSGGVRRGALDSTAVETFRHLIGLSGADFASVTVQNGVLLTLLGFLSRCGKGDKVSCEERLAPAIRLMRLEYSRRISVGECAALCRMSESDFSHQFRAAVGISPYKFLTDIRMEKACDLLLHTELNISAVAQLCGYSDPLYFSRIFKGELGTSPNAWRKKIGAF